MLQVNGSPVSVTVEFDLTQAYYVQSLSPILVSSPPAGRRHLLALPKPANTSSVPGAAEVLRLLTSGSPPNSTVAGRHLLQATLPTTFRVPISYVPSGSF